MRDVMGRSIEATLAYMRQLNREYDRYYTRPFVLSVPMPKGGWPRFDVLHGYAYFRSPRDQFFALLNMPGAE